MFEVIICHGPDDIVKFTAETIKKAEAKATTVERKHHGKKFTLDGYRWEWKSERTKDFMQYGTNYHYVSIARIKR